ncbi:hypothetical protein QTP88_007837 [Uroleucon formosanum]
MIHGNIKDFLAQIEKNKLLTLDSVGQGKRDKRAIFPTIVKTAKVIYGLCDVNCLWNSFLNLKKFRESGSNELKLQDKRIKIIEVKKNRDEEKAKPGLESIHELKKITSAHEVKGQILEHLINIKVLLDQYTFEINSLTDIIQTAKLGQIHPSLISPNELILQLKDIKKLESVHRRSQLRAACCYSTVSHHAAAVVSGIPPIRLLAKERTEVFEGKGKSEARLDLIINWQREWENCTNGRWTFRLINDLPRWQSRTFGEATDSCEQCGFQPDDAEHAFFNCDAWENWRRRVCAEVDVEELTPENLTNTMLVSSFNWNQISKLMSRIMTAREEAERIRQGQPT